MQNDTDEVLATISASPGRRWLAIVALYGLAGMVAYVALVENPAFGWRLFLLAFAGVTIWLSEAMRNATARVIELTRAELRDSSGAVLATVDEIEKIDRGMFAFKPSNGFLIRLRDKSRPRVWYPGLWWRLGRQVGVGGVTPGREAKNMADILAVMLVDREKRD